MREMKNTADILLLLDNADHRRESELLSLLETHGAQCARPEKGRGSAQRRLLHISYDPMAMNAGQVLEFAEQAGCHVKLIGL